MKCEAGNAVGIYLENPFEKAKHAGGMSCVENVARRAERAPMENVHLSGITHASTSYTCW